MLQGLFLIPDVPVTPPASATGSPLTARQLIETVERQFRRAGIFYGHGTDNPLDEAVYLVLASLDIPFECDEELLHQPLSKEQIEHINSLALQRTTERIPVAYLVRQAWFAGLAFYVDNRVPVPRSPLAELIEEGFSPWLEHGRVRRVLDIGTGSACIAIACAMCFESATVDALDLSTEALEVARINVKRHGLEDRVNLLLSDVFPGLGDHSYDLIVSNPPYVPGAEYDGLPAEYAHEPGMALLAASGGTEIIDRILEQAGDFLTDTGILVVETGNTREMVERAWPGLNFTWLEFERGGSGVFMLQAADLRAL